MRWSLRIGLMLIGLVFFVSLLAVAAVLALVWGVRALWARLTGRPVTPWVMRMRPQAGWQTVYRSGAQWMAQTGPSARSAEPYGASRGHGVLPAADVTDVQPREVREP